MTETDDKIVDYSEESSDDDELLLGGQLVRNPDVSSSSSSSEDEDDGNSGNEKNDEKADDKSEAQSSTDTKKRKDAPESTLTSQKSNTNNSKKKKKKDSKRDEEDLEQVEFIFCDIQEPYWHGCKALLMNSSTVYQRHASVWTDWLMEQVVGTVVSTSPDHTSEDHAVFGFAGMVHVHDASINNAEAQQSKADTESAQREQSRIQALEYLNTCVKNDCPTEHQREMQQLFDAHQQPNLFVFLHGRMINLPLEIVLALHQQLWLDWEFDDEQNKSESAGGKKKKKKQAADGAAASPIISKKEARILRLAPCTKSPSKEIIYRYYDDELLAGRSIVQFTVKAPKAYSQEETLFLQVMVLTPTDYRLAIQDLHQLVG